MSGGDDDRWVLFPLQYRERAGTCLVNIDLADESRQSERGVRVLIVVHMNSDDFGGAGSAEERQALDEATDRVIAILARRCGGELAGHLREPGTLALCFYCKSMPPEPVQAAVVGELAGWQVEFDAAEDAEWAYFGQELFPMDMEWEWSNNSSVELSLSRNGDALVVPREVEHWAFFPDQAACDKYAAWLGPEGFEVKSSGLRERDVDQDELEENVRFVVRFTRVDLPTADELSPITHELRRAAGEFGGEYDGWETAVVK